MDGRLAPARSTGVSIERASWATFRLLFAVSFATAHGTSAVREGLILRLTTDDGLVGLGEASPVESFSVGTLADALATVADLAPGLVGRTEDEAISLVQQVNLAEPGAAEAACALDTALHDLRAQRVGLPLASLLGGEAERAVPVNATIGVQDAAAPARAVAEAGFGCLKLKVGLADSAQAEIERVRAVREAIGTVVRLRLDANGAWSVTEAIDMLRKLEFADLELVEQPVAAADLAGLANVRACVGVPIAADESAGTLDQAKRVVEAGAADVLIVKPMLAGGPRAARAMLDLAQTARLGAIVTTTLDTGVGVALALQLAATLPAPTFACGLATGSLLVGDLIRRPLRVEMGSMRLPTGPGLGVALDERQVERYCRPWQESRAKVRR